MQAISTIFLYFHKFFAFLSHVLRQLCIKDLCNCSVKLRKLVIVTSEGKKLNCV